MPVNGGGHGQLVAKMNNDQVALIGLQQGAGHGSDRAGFGTVAIGPDSRRLAWQILLACGGCHKLDLDDIGVRVDVGQRDRRRQCSS